MDLDGAVMNENTEKLPQDCPNRGRRGDHGEDGEEVRGQYPGETCSAMTGTNGRRGPARGSS